MTPTAVPALLPALPEIALAVIAMALLMYGVFGGERSPRGCAWLAVAGLAITAVLVLVANGDRAETFNGQFVVDGFARFMKVLVLLGSGLATIMSMSYMERERMERFEYSVLLLFATLGMLMMISANDLIALYVGLELQSLSLYVVAAIRRDTVKSSEAGLKYFVLGALSSGMLLYGASLIYGFAGTTSFVGLARLFAESSGAAPVGVIIGIVFLCAGLCFKVSAVPFHMWTPDVYEGAPTPVTAFFAVAPKIAAIALFTRTLLGPFGDLVDQWQQIIVAVSIGSMVLGAFAAINQSNIKRLMAYSSIGHMGYALVGLAAGSQAGVRGVVIYVALYLFMAVGTFACILSMRHQGRLVEGIADLTGLSKTHPMMAFMLAVFMFSMAGIPPMAGFFGKFFVFQAAVQAELYSLAVIGVLASVVAAYYYIRIVKLMYFDEPIEALDQRIGGEMTTIMFATGIITLLFFVYPLPLMNGAASAAAALFGG
ncbi:MAG: NADH-quinone oxidoreductase subunit NuoN [Alphaproteobacteria bacterium]|nr:NADH-quinone oxidoreductase subunit NuoN [Alphaproteobacteria bacterium]